jgi:hypothetical protein
MQVAQEPGMTKSLEKLAMAMAGPRKQTLAGGSLLANGIII